jgi:hypothetical protein
MNIFQGRVCITGVHTQVPKSRPKNTNVSNNNFSISEQGLMNLDSSALVSMSLRLPGGGWASASVFKHENHSDRNPLFIIRGVDINGEKFEKTVDVNRVSPYSMNFIEMMALDGHFATQGKAIGAARSVIGALGAGLGTYNVFTMFDGMKPIEEMMVFQRANRNLRGYFHYKNIVDTLTNHMAQRLRIQNNMEVFNERNNNNAF